MLIHRAVHPQNLAVMANAIPFKIQARIDKGKLVVKNTERWHLMLRHFDGREVVITMEEYSDQRTLDQNALYWMYMHLIEDETGEDAKRLHAFFKSEFITPTYIEVFGKQVEVEKSTVNMSKKKFSEFLRKIELLTGIPIPDTEGWRLQP